MRIAVVATAVATSALASSAFALQDTAALERQKQQELRQAESDVPLLVELLALKRGMTVADIGAGNGAMTVVMAKWLGPQGTVFSTDIGATQLAAIREASSRERLTNILVVEGAEKTTNLPNECCDAIFMRDVYHHLRQPGEFNQSLFAALKSGGVLAIIDFEPEAGSTLPAGVADNRGGHGITPAVTVAEVTVSGLSHVKTIPVWPPGSKPEDSFFVVLFRKP